MYTGRSYRQLRQLKESTPTVVIIYVDYFPVTYYPDGHYLLSVWYYKSSNEAGAMLSLDFTSFYCLMRALHFVLRINNKRSE